MSRIKSLIFLPLFFLLSAEGSLSKLFAQPLVLNEWMSRNQTFIQDVDGDYSDWIEIYNTGNSIVNMEGYGLSDNPDEPFKWVLPDVELEAGAFLLIFASGKNYLTGELHCNFSISSAGETLILSDPQGSTIDENEGGPLFFDQSLGRSTDGGDDWQTFEVGTPGFSNNMGLPFEPSFPLFINEFMAQNEDALEDVDGDFSDWIEIYNAGNVTLDLGGLQLSDDEEELGKWSLPSVELYPDDFLLIFASGKDYSSGQLHSSFSIKASGEMLILSESDGSLIDFTNPEDLKPNDSYGRVEDGGDTWATFALSSPDDTNEDGIIKNTIDFSHQAGSYTEAFNLTMTLNGEGTIHYTTDGSEPNENDPIYYEDDDGIEIASRAGDPNVYSTIQATEDELDIDPVGEVFKVNVIRCRAFDEGGPVSKIYTNTFLVDEDPNRYDLPYISLVSDPDNFFDDEIGIYVPGDLYDGDSESTMNCFQSGDEWERPVHIEYVDESGDLELSQNAGIRIHGGGSRRLPQKSFRLYARNDYGKNTFEEAFFPGKDIDDYRRLVLRAQSSSNNTFMTDEIAGKVVGNATDLGWLDSKTMVVFLNGEFWGLYQLRERMDKYFLEDNFGVDKDELNVVEDNPSWACCIEGSAESYEDLLEFIENNDVTESAVYEHIQNEMDVDNFIEYLVAELYMSNYDWPLNNIKYWKTNEEDAKWRWLFFDIDFGMRFEERPSVLNFMNNLTSNVPEWSNFLGKSLMENPDFQEQFIERFEFHLNETFTPENVGCYIQEKKAEMAPYMQEYFDRIDHNFTVDYWNTRVEEMISEFVSLRPCEIRNQIEEEFDVVIDIPDCESVALEEVDCAGFSEEGFPLSLQVFLEGAYINSSGEMRTDLFENGLLATQQPYTETPWNYEGTENVEATTNLEIVDWVLVEMRTGTPSLNGESGTSLVESQAALLLADGNVVNQVGESLRFDNLVEGEEYYILVRHRNHLDVISAIPIEASTNSAMSYDFGSSAVQAFGNGQTKQLSDGRYAMFVGDYQPNGIILITDYDAWFYEPAIVNTYHLNDGNLDGIVQVTDYDIWTFNKAKIGIVEVQLP